MLVGFFLAGIMKLFRLTPMIHEHKIEVDTADVIHKTTLKPA